MKDLQGITDWLTLTGMPFSYAGVYAMAGIHQIYLSDPSHNVMIPAHDVAQSVAFFCEIVGLKEVLLLTTTSVAVRRTANLHSLAKTAAAFFS